MILINLFFPSMLTIFAITKCPSERPPPMHHDPHGILIVKTRFDLSCLIVHPVKDVSKEGLKRSFKVKTLLNQNMKPRSWRRMTGLGLLQLKMKHSKKKLMVGTSDVVKSTLYYTTLTTYILRGLQSMQFQNGFLISFHSILNLAFHLPHP